MNKILKILVFLIAVNEERITEKIKHLTEDI
jgi:hypothetical protein